MRNGLLFFFETIHFQSIFETLHGAVLEISERSHISGTTQGFELCTSYMKHSYLISRFEAPELPALRECADSLTSS